MTVYFIIARPSLSVKIGWTLNSNAAEKKRKEFQTGNHEELQVMRTTRGLWHVEAFYHKEFQELRTCPDLNKHEWFRFCPNMLTIDPPVNLIEKENNEFSMRMKHLMKQEPDILQEENAKKRDVLGELHYYVNGLYLKTKSGVPTMEIWKFLSQRVPTNQIDKTFTIAERVNIIARTPRNPELWLPRPKSVHGIS